MTDLKLKKHLWRIVQWLFMLAILFFWGRAIWRNWDVLRAYPWRVSWIGLVLSFGALVLQALLLAALWRRVLTLMGVPLTWRQGNALWLQAQIARYVPGGVWEVAARVVMGRRLGVSGRVMSAVYGLELGLQMLSGGVFLLGALALRVERLRTTHLVLASAAALALLATLAPPVFNRLVNWGLRILRRPAVQVEATYSDIQRLFGGYLLAHLLSGLSFVLFLYGVEPVAWSQVPLLVLAYAGAWLAGQVAVFVPTGIGVREGALSLILGARYAFVTISTVALMYRIWIALRDLLIAFYGKWLDRNPLGPQDAGPLGHVRDDR